MDLKSWDVNHHDRIWSLDGWKTKLYGKFSIGALYVLIEKSSESRNVYLFSTEWIEEITTLVVTYQGL